MKTMHEVTGEPNDKIGKHLCCDECGMCKTCKDCNCKVRNSSVRSSK